MNMNAIVYGEWTFFALIWLVSSAVASIYGWKGRGSLKNWRWVKLGSTLFGAAGLALLLLQIEAATRKPFESRDDRILSYIDAKLMVAEQIPLWCRSDETNKDFKFACDRLHTDDLVIDNDLIINNLRIEHVSDWDKQVMKEFVARLNRQIDLVNMYVDTPATDQRPILSDDAKLRLLAIALILLIIASAGSLGDAVFQLKQASGPRS